MARVVYTGEGCTGCKACSVACVYAHERAFGLSSARIFVMKAEPLTDFPVVCHHCGKPLCEEACPIGAIAKRGDGLVVVDEKVCIGCGACIEACPFGAMSLHPIKRVAINCDLCGGLEPACVKFCPSRVLKLQAPEAVAQVKRVKGR